MQYQNEVREGVFLARPNRFLAQVQIDGAEKTVHVKNTGRCRELLVPGARVYVECFGDETPRKTKYDLVAVDKAGLLINMDSQAPNRAAGEFLAAGGLLPGPGLIKAEQKWGGSRFDFYVEAGERRAFVEVKGVTLEEEGRALFPDAPTQRGVKHLRELGRAVREGYEAWVLFVIQMKGIQEFCPNERTHPEFAQALRQAQAEGVRIAAYDCRVTPRSLTLDRPVAVRLKKEETR